MLSSTELALLLLEVVVWVLTWPGRAFPLRMPCYIGSCVSGAVKYRVYVANVQSHPAEGLVNVDHPNITDDFHSDGNENQAEDQVSNWFDTGESPIINELESTVRVQISTPNLYSGNYMGDSELLAGESVKLVVTSIDVNGYESPIGTTTPLSITDGKGPQHFQCVCLSCI